ncbi:MAG: SsrA-binding protein SmpB [Candidatus Omnitrophica bacterium]|nr:SsrA-binding protein SmpB [Candidatus Omnitrophota bacterium]MBI3010287.1 SsrA-binding protein SmpB [Candidatus Omnitrophota bacterium]
MKPKGTKDKSEEPAFATNRKARHHYDILETFEAGLELKGTEIKAIRQRRANLDGSFARIDGGELFLYNMHISPYEQGGYHNVEPTRPRRLLMHRRQIDRIAGQLTQKRLTIVALKLYPVHGLAKVEIALARGKRVFEKRDRIRSEELNREIRRTMRSRQQR